MPALPLDEAGKYVAGAYIVFVVLILIYVSIMAVKLARIEAELRELAGFAERHGDENENGDDAGETPGRGRQVDRVAEEMRS
jgi:hypothetical protein